MSVVARTYDGRDYLHVRQKVNKVQHQVFINVTDLSPKELALKKYQARKIDERYTSEKPQHSIASMLTNKDGSLKHIRVFKPNKKNNWCVKVFINSADFGRFHKSSSIEKNGIDEAINTIVTFTLEQLNIKKNSPSWLVFMSLYREFLSREYYRLRGEYSLTSKAKL